MAVETLLIKSTGLEFKLFIVISEVWVCTTKLQKETYPLGLQATELYGIAGSHGF